MILTTQDDQRRLLRIRDSQFQPGPARSRSCQIGKRPAAITNARNTTEMSPETSSSHSEMLPPDNKGRS